MTFVRSLATNAKFNIREPPKYTLGSLRSFPSLEPHQFIPLPADFLDAPKRRDFLWSSVVYEADNSRVGSGNVTTRGDQPFSHKKLRPQKGSGMARTGDANSPHRYNSIKLMESKLLMIGPQSYPIRFIAKHLLRRFPNNKNKLECL